MISGAVDMATLFSEQARPAGINITPSVSRRNNFWANIWLVEPFPVVQWGARPTPDSIFSLVFQSGVAWNEGRWSNERFDSLLFEAKGRTRNPMRRTEMYTEMKPARARREPGSHPDLRQPDRRFGATNVMHTEQIASNWELDGARSYQRWWFA